MNAPAVTTEADQPEAEELDPIEQATRCRSIWASALALLVEDAVRYATGAKRGFHTPEHTGEQALDDICRLGPMTRHLCSKTGNSPEWLRDQTKRVILEIRDGERGLKIPKSKPQNPRTRKPRNAVSN